MQISMLRKSPLFVNCSDDDIYKFCGCVGPKEVRAEAQTRLHEQDTPLSHIMFLLDGHVRLERNEYNGTVSIMDRLAPGDVYGHLSAFDNNLNEIATLIAEDDVHYLLFQKNAFYQHCSQACATHARVTRNMLSLIAGQNRRLSNKISYLMCSSLKGKIALYLLHQGGHVAPGEPFQIPLNREDLAGYLAVQRPSLSRTLAQMKEEGIIDFKRSTFRILDMDALMALY